MKKSNFLVIIAVLCLVIPVLAADPYDGYIGPSISGASPLNVTFTDISYGEVVSWNWTRHDVITAGSAPISFSTLASPGSITFTAGNWSIQLTTTNAYGTNTTRANVTFVNVTGAGAPPVASFTGTPLTGNGSVVTTFTDSSTNATSWEWQRNTPQHPTWATFSTSQNPTLTTTYSSDHGGLDNIVGIRLIATNAAGSNTSLKPNYITVSAPVPDAPIANFTPRGTHLIEPSRMINYWLLSIENNTVIQFNDTSTGGTVTNWNWSFQKADGTIVYSGSQNPSMTFNTTTFGDGVERTMRLNASNSAGFSIAYTTFTIHRPPVVPVAQYYATNTITGSSVLVYGGTDSLVVSNGQTVTFTDVSLNTPTSWRWDISAGNGSVYTYYTRNATMYYTDASAGYYPVTFAATNSDGTSTISSDTIHIQDYTAPNSVSGITNSTNSSAIQWNWTMSSDTAGVRIWKDGVLFENVTTPGTLWTGLTSETTYNISTKTYDLAGNLNATFVNSTATTAGTNWTITSNTNWVCPTGVTRVVVQMVGGGGSGAGSFTNPGLWSYAGLAGDPGEHKTYLVDVIPGNIYPIVIGLRGENKSSTTVSVLAASGNSGTATTAFGFSVAGGAGGLSRYPASTAPGGNATDGIWSITRFALNGTGETGVGGICGIGYGAPGGGAGAYTTVASIGGHGAGGVVIITDYATSAVINIPDFVADKTESDPGTLIHFTDLSTIADTAGLLYNWSFGDGEYSSVVGNTQHVYPYTGSYDVSLNITTANGSITETKPTYINIVTSPMYPYIPQQVRFKLVDTSGFPLSGVGITATPLNATIPANWSELLFRINPTVNIEGTSVVGMTGSDGSWVAPMLPSYLYNINMFRAYDINYTIQMYPSQNEYLFTIPIGVVPIQTIVPGLVTYSLSNASINRSYQYFNMSYSDTSVQGTDKLSFYVYNLAGDVVAAQEFAGADAKNQTFSRMLEVSQGQSYTYGFAANQSQYGWINQTQTVTLANQIALIGDAPSWVEEFAAIAIILLFAALFSIYSKPFAMIALPLLTWFFQFIMGWLPSNFVSTIALGVMLTLGVAIYIRQKESTIS